MNTRTSILNSQKKRPAERQGAAAIEAALVLSAATLLLFGALDASLAVLRRNLLENAVCKAARVAAVHGSRSTSPLGPAGWSGTVADNNVISIAIRPMLASLSPASVTVEAAWPDGDNEEDSRVTVHLSAQTPSILAALFGSVWTIQVASTVPIAH